MCSFLLIRLNTVYWYHHSCNLLQLLPYFMQSVWARSKAFIFYKGKPFPLPIWVYSFTSPSYLLHFLHQVQRGWSFVGHLPFGSNNTGSSNKTTSSKLGPKYLPMGTYHLGMLPLRTEGCACRALEHSSPLTPRHAGNTPGHHSLAPTAVPKVGFLSNAEKFL